MISIDTTTYRRDMIKKPGDGYDLRPAGIAPSSLVIHSTNGNKNSSFASEASYLRDNSNPVVNRRVSAHYIVGKEGQIAQILDDTLAGWQAGAVKPGYAAFANDYSIGIENHHAVGDTWPKAQHDALAALCRLLMVRWRIPPKMIETHRKIAFPDKRKSDPNDWSDTDFYAWRDRLIIPVTHHQVIGVKPSITLDRFINLLHERKAPFDTAYFDIICERLYRRASDFEIDPAFWLALWTHEQGVPLGGSQVGQATHNPLNIKAYDIRVLPSGQQPRWPRVLLKGSWWNAHESWYLGCDMSLAHLKEVYGARGLLHVETIIPVWAPTTDNNNSDAYISAVLADMRAMQLS